jgi:hypothetical protein
MGGRLCAPTQSDGNLIHHRRSRERTDHPRAHHHPHNVSAARQKAFIAAQ